jgi:DNA polymerase I-like protein with 3'-5' exonuclease and polymerase domains
MYGWVPKELTATGNPALHEAALMDIAKIYPVAAKVAEYHLVSSRIAVLSDGPTAYFKLCDENDVLHGRIIHSGTVTGRCAHRSPNTGNICSVRKPYGAEMRSVFIPFKGYRQAGFDADGLELRMLANRLAPYDDGAYAGAVHSGKKENGTDVHTMHAEAISEIYPVSRDEGKSVTYAWLYGGGNTLLGRLVKGGNKKGAAVRRALVRKIAGMGMLQEELAAAFKRGHVTSLLGMRVGIRHEHAVLNSQLQSDGAAVMKMVPLVLLDLLEEAGVRVGVDYIPTGHIHDEVQGSLKPGLEDTFSDCVGKAFDFTQTHLNIQVPLVGSAEFGSSWADTH